GQPASLERRPPPEPRAGVRRDGSQADRRKPCRATFIVPPFGIPAPRNGGPLDERSAKGTRCYGNVIKSRVFRARGELTKSLRTCFSSTRRPGLRKTASPAKTWI